MTDAAFGHATLVRPIKNEHSYSLNSEGGSLPDSPQSLRKDGEDFSSNWGEKHIIFMMSLEKKTISENWQRWDLSVFQKLAEYFQCLKCL